MNGLSRVVTSCNRRIQQLVNFLFFENCALFFLVSLILVAVLLYMHPQALNETLIVGFTAMAAYVAIFTFVLNHRTTTLRHYARLNTDISSLENNQESAAILEKVRRGSHKDLIAEKNQYRKYRDIAHLSLNTCLQIYRERLWRKTLFVEFIPFLERIRMLHWDWLLDNASFFDNSFFFFMKRAEWRELIPADKADQLRWIYEVDMYEKLVIYRGSVGQP